jgi:GT2 family glycosyltransferase
MEINPLISIVVLNYNGLEFLKKTIPSFFAQDYLNYEIIIVDNGSTDKSLEYLDQFSRVKVVKNKENLGYNKGKNIGVLEAKGDFILLLDEDIEIIQKSFLSSVFSFYNNLILRHSNIGFLSPMLFDDGKFVTKYYGIYYSLFGKKVNKKMKLEQVIKYNEDIQIGAFHGGAVFFKKDLWLEIGGFDDDYKFGMDDFDVGARSWIMGYSNFLYKNNDLVHLGKNKDNDRKRFANKFASYYEGLAVMAFKNYKLSNLILFFVIFLPYIVVLNTALIIYKKNIYLMKSPFVGAYKFIKSIPVLKNKRKVIQKNRIVQNDLFLKIKAPTFL